MRSSVLLAAALTVSSGAARAADTLTDIGATRISRPIASFRELRDRNVIRQRYDFSCGAAAFATLLRYGFGEEIGEEETLRRLFATTAEPEKRLIQDKGLSLLDMQRLAQERGYRAQGFRLAPDQLRKVSRPVLVFIRPLGYEHFAVLRGFRGDRVILADPSQGNWSLTLSRFLEMWLDGSGRGVIFVAEKAEGWPAESPLYVDRGTRPAAARLPTRLLVDPARPPGPVSPPRSP